MPRRRSSRLKGKVQDVEKANVETGLVKDIASETKDVESVSNNNKKLMIEEVEQKDPSEPQSMEQTPDHTLEQQPTTAQQDEDMEQEQEEEEEVHQTLIAGRSRRNVVTKSYKDDSSSEEEDEDDDPMYAGLSKEQRQAMKDKMAEMQKGCNDATLKERALKIQEIIGSFELNIDADVTEEEAAFIYDFSRKHQFDVIEKIEDEGDFFLDSMREMIEEKMKLHQAGIRTNGGKRKRRKDEDSESEFDMNDFEDSDSDSEYSLDSDFENPFEDNENMIDEYEDEEDYAAWGDKKRRRRGGKRRRNKNIYKVDGREYYAKGRLLLTDALKDTENFEGWSAARVKAWKNKEVNPNAYHYRFNLPGEEAINGGLRDNEIKPFMERVKELGVNVHWGTFSAVIKGRVGYQCSNYWRQFMKDGWVKDPNYWILPDGKFQFKRGKNKDIPESIRRYSFVVLKDPSGTFGPDFPAFHPKRPSDAQLKKWLETDVRDLDDSVKAGKKGKKKSRARGKGKGKKKNDDNETKDNKEEEEEEEATNDDKNNDSETTDKDNKEIKKKSKKKKDKKKKKKSKKKDKKDGDDDDDENEENDETKDKKTKKKKSKKAKKSSKKDKKKKDKKSKSKQKSKKKKGKKGEEGNDNDEKEDNEIEQEQEKETASKSKRGKKRKHSESAGDETSELEPPQKKRKKMNKSKKAKKEDKNKKEMNIDSEKENEEETEDALSKVLGDMVDIMTGDKLIDPAISPYGYIMSYNSWCSILRNSKTKNKCPFTKQKLTRRSLIKLTVDNIGEYEDQIVNVTEEERKNFML